MAVLHAVQVTLSSGSVAAVPLLYNTSSLAPGVYQALIEIESNDPLLPTVNLTVSLACACASCCKALSLCSSKCK